MVAPIQNDNESVEEVYIALHRGAIGEVLRSAMQVSPCKTAWLDFLNLCQDCFEDLIVDTEESMTDEEHKAYCEGIKNGTRM